MDQARSAEKLLRGAQLALDDPTVDTASLVSRPEPWRGPLLAITAIALGLAIFSDSTWPMLIVMTLNLVPHFFERRYVLAATPARLVLLNSSVWSKSLGPDFWEIDPTSVECRRRGRRLDVWTLNEFRISIPAREREAFSLLVARAVVAPSTATI